MIGSVLFPTGGWLGFSLISAVMTRSPQLHLSVELIPQSGINDGKEGAFVILSESSNCPPRVCMLVEP